MEYSSISPEELVRACLETGDEAAWREFVRRFQPLIASVVLRVARRFGENSTQVVDDLVQETYLKLCSGHGSLLREFQPAHQGAIFGYIKVFTANLVYDHFKAIRSWKRGGSLANASLDDENVAPISSAARMEVEDLTRAVLIQEIESCLASIDSGMHAKRDRRIFWLYYRTGLSARAIAALPTTGLSTKGVETILHRLTLQVRDRFVGHKQERLNSKRAEKGIQPAESL